LNVNSKKKEVNEQNDLIFVFFYNGRRRQNNLH